MPQMDVEDFKFPDETDQEPAQRAEAPDFEIEVEDDTPTSDRGREPMPKPLVEELEKDELDVYDDVVKEKLKQMRKVWHDERREKEAALREHNEAVNLAQKLIEENKRIKSILSAGEKEYVSTIQNAANMELEMAKRSYKEAYDSGDSDKLVEAQQAMQAANLKLMQANSFRIPSLQDQETEVKEQPQYQPAPPRVDRKAEAWQERNPWFGRKKGMTAFALGVHEELRDDGVEVGSDEYYRALDKKVRLHFPEAFPGEEEESSQQSRPKPATVVAPATRSAAPKKVKLRQSQLNLIAKLKITPEQYVREFLKTEN
jgi:hypothetical protein